MRNLVFAALLLIVSFNLRAQQPCESLTSLKLERATVTSAVAFLEGAVTELAGPHKPHTAQRFFTPRLRYTQAHQAISDEAPI
ncbi:MAG: hypothetical protein ABSF54_27245 [Bryobacteraceae bacterium]|jgi:hypothetical protein